MFKLKKSVIIFLFCCRQSVGLIFVGNVFSFVFVFWLFSQEYGIFFVKNRALFFFFFVFFGFM